jgi:hypothetical protein
LSFEIKPLCAAIAKDRFCYFTIFTVRKIIGDFMESNGKIDQRMFCLAATQDERNECVHFILSFLEAIT